MPRKAAGLSAIRVRSAKPGRYGDGNGLYLFVRSPDARFWVFRYTRAGRMREMGLGSARTFSLAEARTKAAELHRKVKEGIDPLAERDALAATAAEAVTFAHVADRYIAAHEAGWRNDKHKQQWRNTIDTYAAPILGALPVGFRRRQPPSREPRPAIAPACQRRCRSRRKPSLSANSVAVANARPRCP